MVLDTAKLRQRNSIPWPMTRNEIQHIVIRNSDHSYRLSKEVFKRFQGQWYISLKGRNAPMKLRSDFREALTKKHRLHRESGKLDNLTEQIG